MLRGEWPTGWVGRRLCTVEHTCPANLFPSLPEFDSQPYAALEWVPIINWLLCTQTDLAAIAARV
jgi:hypothetical protein